MSETLTDFLLARIAERESVAIDMQDQARLGRPFFDTERLAGGTGIRELIDPAHVLVECEAKRRIVEGLDGWDPELGTTGQIAVQVLQLLALPYADHPDYREEWRP